MNNLSSHPVELIAEPMSGVLAQLAHAAAAYAQAGTVADPDGRERPEGTWERLRIALEYARGLALHAEARREDGRARREPGRRALLAELGKLAQSPNPAKYPDGTIVSLVEEDKLRGHIEGTAHRTGALAWTDNPDGSATITDPEDGTTTHIPREINSNPLGRSAHQCRRCGMQLVVMRINPPAIRCDRCRRILGKEEIADLLAGDG